MKKKNSAYDNSQYHQLGLVSDECVLLLHQAKPLLHQFGVILLAHPYKRSAALKLKGRTHRKQCNGANQKHNAERGGMYCPKLSTQEGAVPSGNLNPPTTP